MTVGEPLGERLSRPAVDELVAIGDLHGDLTATRRALVLAGAIDDRDRWIGGRLIVVQTGDTLDRGDQDRAVFDLMERLRGEAEKVGGALLSLSGNHEVMNVAGDFRYVSPGSFAEFGDPRGRLEAFAPGGVYARQLAARPIVMRVGDTVFVHGGILPKHVRYGLRRMSDEVRAWMLGQRAAPPPIAVGEDGPIWTRLYSSGAPSSSVCAQLSDVLRDLDAKRMVVGHTPQPGGINAACEGKVWRIDTGMSHHYGGPVQVLALHKGVPEVRSVQAEAAE